MDVINNLMCLGKSVNTCVNTFYDMTLTTGKQRHHNMIKHIIRTWAYFQILVTSNSYKRFMIFDYYNSEIRFTHHDMIFFCYYSHKKTVMFAYGKTKAQISCAVTAQLISAFGFTIESTMIP